MKRLVLFIVLLAMIASSCFATSSSLVPVGEPVDDAEEFVVIPSGISSVVHPNAIIVTSLTPEQVPALRSGPVQHGSYSLSVPNQDAYEAGMPYRFQVVSGTYNRVASRIEFGGAFVGPDPLTAEPRVFYHFETGTAYSSTRVYPFDLMSDQPIHGKGHLDADYPIVYVDVLASPLGDKDFINEPDVYTQFRKLTFAQLICLSNPEFDQQTRGGIRQNQRIISLLLMISQQEGEDIHGLSPYAREARGMELFMCFLMQYGLKLDGLEDSLGKRVYTQAIPTMARLILKNAGVDPTYLPSDLEMQAGEQMAMQERKQSPEVTDLQYIVPLHPVRGHAIQKIVSPARLFKPARQRPIDGALVELERQFVIQMRMAQAGMIVPMMDVESGGTGVNVPWIVFRHGVLDPLEREAVGQFNVLIAAQMAKHLPGGDMLCKALIGAAHIGGKKRISDVVVDTLHFGYNPVKSLKGGLRTEAGAEFADGVAGTFMGFLPCGGLVYEGGRCLLTYSGYASPAHRALGIAPDAEVQDRGLATTAQTLRSGLKLFVPGGHMIVGAAKGVAWYLDEDSLTAYLYHKRYGKVSPVPAIEVGESSSNSGGDSENF